MKSAYQYLIEILYLVGESRSKLPALVLLFLFSSILDLLGLGLIAPYVSLIMNFENQNIDWIGNKIIALGLPMEQEFILIWMGVVLITVFLFKALTALYINHTIIVFSNMQEVRLKSYLMQTYQHLPYTEYIKRNSAEYVNAIIGHTISFRGALEMGLKTLSDGIIAIAIFSLLALTNGIALSLLVIILGVLVFGYDRVFRSRIKEYGRQSHHYATRLVQGVNEGIEGFKEIRILGKEKYFYDLIKHNAERWTQNQGKTNIISSSPRYFLEFVLITFIVMLVITAYLFGNNLKALVPTIGFIGMAALRLLPVIHGLSNSLVHLRHNRFAVGWLYTDLIKLKESPKSVWESSTKSTNDEFHELVLDGIQYFYPESKMPALDQISLRIQEGETVGFIGPSGAGKTTLVDLILGLFKPSKGSLLYNGEELKGSLSRWQSQIAYLPQQVFLIDNTLRNNVALGINDNEIDDQLVHGSLNNASLQEFVDTLPQGIETKLGERGVRLSGGQRQRVAIARAFYHGRNVLVMDEATSALDHETESEIVEEIKRLKGKKTIIVIAHRLTTVQHCDRILKSIHILFHEALPSHDFPQIHPHQELKFFCLP